MVSRSNSTGKLFHNQRNHLFMKRFTLALLLSMLSGVVLEAQTAIGLKGGISASDFASPHFSRNVYHTHPALIGGIAVGRQLSPKLAIQAEVLYSRQGAEISGKDIGVQLNYLNLPLQLKYFPISNTFLGVGFQYGFLVSENRRLDDQISELPKALIENNALRSHDATIPISIGYLSEVGVQLEVRYHFGLVNVFQNPLLESRNRTIQFTLTYFLAGKRNKNSLFANNFRISGATCRMNQ